MDGNGGANRAGQGRRATSWLWIAIGVLFSGSLLALPLFAPAGGLANFGELVLAYGEPGATLGAGVLIAVLGLAVPVGCLLVGIAGIFLSDACGKENAGGYLMFGALITATVGVMGAMVVIYLVMRGTVPAIG